MLIGSDIWKSGSSQCCVMRLQASSLYAGWEGWHTDAGGTARMRRPETVLFSEAHSDVEGQHGSLGRCWRY
jgi:hypothetical protein